MSLAERPVRSISECFGSDAWSLLPKDGGVNAILEFDGPRRSNMPNFAGVTVGRGHHTSRIRVQSTFFPDGRRDNAETFGPPVRTWQGRAPKAATPKNQTHNPTFDRSVSGVILVLFSTFRNPEAGSFGRGRRENRSQPGMNAPGGPMPESRWFIAAALSVAGMHSRAPEQRGECHEH
jgi:hypothetical protein